MFFKKPLSFESLSDGLDFAFQMLEKGARHYRHAFHFPALITGDSHGVSARTVILRSFSKQGRSLICHSDVRSAKIRQIRENNRVSWLFYDPGKCFQLRISGKAEVHTDNSIADDQWKTVRLTSRMNYLTPLPPGKELDSRASGLSMAFSEKVMNSLDASAGREHFGVVEGRLEHMDWLVLGVAGHLRARFSWKEGTLNAAWVVP